jgi:hypothetical protein
MLLRVPWHWAASSLQGVYSRWSQQRGSSQHPIACQQRDPLKSLKVAVAGRSNSNRTSLEFCGPRVNDSCLPCTSHDWQGEKASGVIRRYLLLLVGIGIFCPVISSPREEPAAHLISRRIHHDSTHLPTADYCLRVRPRQRGKPNEHDLGGEDGDGRR